MVSGAVPALWQESRLGMIAAMTVAPLLVIAGLIAGSPTFSRNFWAIPCVVFRFAPANLGAAIVGAPAQRGG